MLRCRHNDAGQAFPIYITVVAGLLFLALAYLAVGQAAVNRNGAQTAADAAALALAQDARGQLAALWVQEVLDPAEWQHIFDGTVGVNPSCGRANQLAEENYAHVQVCRNHGALSYTVSVKTDKPVGKSVVPGTEGIYGTASATAVIKALCTFDPPGADAGKDTLPPLTCGGKTWDPNPHDLTNLPGPEDLFDVHLADSTTNDE
ncbi:pilus assembly protein TadG-related protein [Streptomyces sp. NPDC001348]